MKIPNRCFLLLGIIVFSYGCTSSRLNKLSEQGHTAYANSQYEEALAYYNDMIELAGDNHPKKAGAAHGEAGKAAYALGRKDAAISHFEKAAYLDYKNEDMYHQFVQVTREADNFSKEMNALADYVQYFPDGEYIQTYKKRLFLLYAESENWDKARELWTQLPDETKQQEKYLEGYLKTTDAQEREKEAKQTAEKLLDINARNKTALQWKAEKHFWEAENSYQEEMTAYKNNRTNAQYQELLKALKQINADYKRSLNYFKKLYKTDPQKEYAQYLGNIYKRLDDEQKAEYYYRLAE